MESVKIIECPRDAWQGLPKIIPTEAKVAYLRKLIEAGFRHLDAVSFVAPKYVPQMADSEAVMAALREQLAHATGAAEERGSKVENRKPGIVTGTEGRRPDTSFEFRVSNFEPEIIGIVVNAQGLGRALATPGVTTIGYPYSISAHFRRANANMSRAESRALVEKLRRVVETPGAIRHLVVYISMAFGNNYGEPWGPEIVEEALLWMKGIGVKTVSLADTMGTAEPKEVGDLLRAVKDAGEGIELGVHLHGRPENAAEKVLAAFEAGCRRFDCALTGLGGCPFAGDELVGNIPTEIVVSTLSSRGVQTGIEPWGLLSAIEATNQIRSQYARA